MLLQKTKGHMVKRDKKGVKYMWILMLILYLSVGMFSQIMTFEFVNITVNTYKMNYFILPTMCIILSICFLWYFLNIVPRSGNVDKKLALLWAFYFAAIMIIIQMAAGIFIDKLGKNPYDQSITGMVSNLYYALPFIFFRENIRSSIINKTNYFKTMFVLLLVCTSVTSINIPGIMLLNGTEEIVIYAAQYIIPVIIENIFLNMMATYGGAIPCITYIIMLELMEWIFPVTPMLNWLTKTVISVFVGGIIILMLGDLINECHGKYRRNKKKKKPEKLFGQISIMGICVLIIWFFVGVFGVYPSVVLTGSMEPKIKPGDMILIDKINNEKEISKLKEGDVITFRRDDITITHRIIEKITDESGNITFRTKGDNNSSEDTRIVNASEVLGKYIYVIPKVGIPVLWLKGSSNEVPEGVEF